MKLLKALLVMGVVVVLVGACGPAATPEPAVVEKTVVVEKEVEVTKVVEKEVEVVVTATPEPTAPPTPAPTGPKRGGTLHVSFTDWPKNVFNQIDSGTEGCYVEVNIQDGLLNIDVNGNIIPGLAKELPERPDDVTYIFHLREGVKFHNGTDFDAEDVLYTYDRLVGKIEGEHCTQATRYAGHIKSVEALDKYTVKITLKAPWEDFVNLMAYDKYQDILSKEAVHALGDDYGLTGAVGTGPFKFKEWVKGDHITLVRNEDYWGEPPYLDAIVYEAIPEESTRIISFLAGETDLMLDPPLKDVEALTKDPKIRVEHCDSGDKKWFFVNTTKPPFDDKQVRQAVFYAIDRESIMDTLYYGWGVVGQGIFSPGHYGWDPQDDWYPYDPDKAKEMLADAGYTEANPLEFEISTGNATEYIDISTMIQAQLASIGVAVTIDAMEAAAWTAKTWPKGDPRTANPGFEAAVYRLKYVKSTTNMSWRTHHSKGALNSTGHNQPGGYQHPEVDELLDIARHEPDQEKRQKLNWEVSDLIMDDAVDMTIGWVKNVNVMHDYVKGTGCWNRDDWPLKDVWLDK